MDLSGLLNVLLFTGIFASIHALLSLGLNLQWGYTGLFNVGIAGFYAIGAYTSALLTIPPSPYHLGGFSVPIPVGMVGALLTSGLLAYIIGKPTLRLRADYLVIATISIAETLRFQCVRADRGARVSGQRAAHTLAMGAGTQGHSRGRSRGCQRRERCLSLRDAGPGPGSHDHGSGRQLLCPLCQIHQS